MKIKYLLIILIVLGFKTDITAQNNSDIFTIYLVRHAEKDLSVDSYTDPPLTPCGKQRAIQLSNFFQDINLEAVYSTNYNRTENTALPTANAKGLKLKGYNAAELENFSEVLLGCKKDVLVVGHSNTTTVLAGLLIGEKIEAFDLDIYNRIYQVVISKNSGRIHLFHSAFSCKN